MLSAWHEISLVISIHVIHIPCMSIDPDISDQKLLFTLHILHVVPKVQIYLYGGDLIVTSQTEEGLIMTHPHEAKACVTTPFNPHGLTMRMSMYTVHWRL